MRAHQQSPERQVGHQLRGADPSRCLLLEYVTCRHSPPLLVDACYTFSSLAVETVRLVGRSDYSSFLQDTF